MSQEPDDTSSLFDRIARRYDWWSTLLSAAGIRAWHALALDLLDLRPGLRVLDVGCGTGRATRAMARRVGRGGEVVGLDPSRGMLEVARMDHRPGPEMAALHWVEGEAEALPFEDRQFDRVTAQFSLRNTRRWPQALAEMVRVLKPEGRLLILDVLQPVTNLGGMAWAGLKAALSTLPPAERQFYEWLGLSVRHAPSAGELEDAMRSLGIGGIRTHFWLGDLVAIVYGQKRAHLEYAASTKDGTAIWAVDGSWAAYSGHRWLARHLRPGSHVHPVTVVPTPAGRDPGRATDRAYWEGHLHDAIESLEGLPFAVHPALLEGDPGPALVGYAKTVGASLLLLGYKSREALAERLLGGVWSYVLSHAPCSVVALRTEADAEG
ncbi:MAG: class I SAM-dependent methyltransferase [Firmicutes bacterium]|nr:class I SAM-dependent methyltransferase [Alicyclobacillaceae bacterium]MCL6497878.1 class I SAM-dependent methyltransferase [Bacillota bacterium]